MEIDGDTIEVIEEDADGTEIYGEELGVEIAGDSGDEFRATSSNASGPVTIYRLIKLEHAEALGISLQEGSVTSPNQKTKIITRNIIKLNRPPKKLILAQKNSSPISHYTVRVDEQNKDDPLIIEDPTAYNTKRRFVCKLCNKGFRHASHLRRHINSHTGEKVYDCESCDKSFLDASTLCRHRRIHTGDRPYSCKFCHKCFGTLGSLRRHMTVHNQKSRPYGCSVCSKRFPDNSSFQKHKLIHTGIKPYECDICNKSFVHIGDLNGHKKVHDEIKPWKCNRCDKQFSKQSNCARHLQIHEGDKEFVCHLCGVGYNYQSSLTRHLLTHRKKENPKRKNSRKVVILAKVNSNNRQSKDRVEPSNLTLRQIKYLVRENKINFGDSDEDASGNETKEIEIFEENEGGSKEIEIKGSESANEENEEENEVEIPDVEETSRPASNDEVGLSEKKTVKHFGSVGDIKYIIEAFDTD